MVERQAATGGRRLGRHLWEVSLLSCVSSEVRHAAIRPPSWVFDGVGRSQVSSQVVTQKDHGFQAHFFPPLLDGLHKLLLCLLSIGREVGSAAPPEAQQVQGVDGPLLGQNVKILSPQAHAASKPMEQNHGSFSCLPVEFQGPELVAIGDGHILF